MCLPVNREKNIKSSSSLKHQEIYLGTNRIKRDWSQDLFFFEPKEKLHYFINFSNCRLCASYFYKMVHLFSPMLLYSVNFRDEDLSLLFDIFSKYIIYEHKMWVDILFLFFQLSPVLYNLFQIELFIASNALLHEFFFHIYLLRCFFFVFSFFCLIVILLLLRSCCPFHSLCVFLGQHQWATPPTRLFRYLFYNICYHFISACSFMAGLISLDITEEITQSFRKCQLWYQSYPSFIIIICRLYRDRNIFISG